MIKANELRIGNAIMIDKKHVSKVVSIDAERNVVRTQNDLNRYLDGTSGDEFYLSSSYISGIPITPEWLTKLGFVKDRNGWHLPDTQFSLTDNLFPCWLDRMLWPGGLPDFHHVALQHVHQLQNLYYWLSGGKELTTSPLP